MNRRSALTARHTDWLLSGDPVNISRVDAFLARPVLAAGRHHRRTGEQLLTALAAATADGTPALAAVSALAGTTGAVGKAASSLARDLSSGASLASAVSAHPRLFGPGTGAVLAEHARVAGTGVALRRVVEHLTMASGERDRLARATTRRAARVSAAAASALAVLLIVSPSVPSSRSPLLAAALTVAAVTTAAAGLQGLAALCAAASPKLARLTGLASAGAGHVPQTLELLAALLENGTPVRQALTVVARTRPGDDGLQHAAAAAWAGSDLSSALSAAPVLRRYAPELVTVTSAEHAAQVLHRCAGRAARSAVRVPAWQRYGSRALTAATWLLTFVVCWAATR